MPTITRPRKPSNKAKAKTPSKVKLPTRDPLDRTMARASALVWPRAAHPRPFADRTVNKAVKKRLQKTIGAFVRELKRRPDAWSLDSLPYSEAFERFVAKHYGASNNAEVFLTVYLTALRLRKTGELAPPKAKAKPKAKARAARKRPAKATPRKPLTLAA
jgi:hypothetical protein